MPTQCNTPKLHFQGLHRRRVEAAFNGGQITSDAGALLLREVEARRHIIARLAACFSDHRRPERIEHTVHDLLAQRIYALALGYEDINDHDRLRHDVLLATLVGKDDPTGQRRKRDRDRGAALAGKSTLNRLECTPEQAPGRYHKITYERAAIEALFVELFLDAHDEPPSQITIDLFADRTSCHAMRANQLRLWLSSVGYVLLSELRRLGLRGTEMARAQASTIRLKLLKIGAQVSVSARRVMVRLSSAYPYAALFAAVLGHLQRAGP